VEKPLQRIGGLGRRLALKSEPFLRVNHLIFQISDLEMKCSAVGCGYPFLILFVAERMGTINRKWLILH